MCDKPECAAERAKTDADKRLESIRQYGWDWFSYHAEQRTNMFNYSLAAAAILAAAYGAVVDKHPPVASVIAVVGALVTFSFILVDGRNQHLVHSGEAVLKAVETILFADAAVPASPLGVAKLPGGILNLEPTASNLWSDFWSGKHRIHLRLVEGALCLAFVSGAIGPHYWPRQFKSDEPDAAKATAALTDRVTALGNAVAGVGDKLEQLHADMRVPAAPATPPSPGQPAPGRPPAPRK